MSNDTTTRQMRKFLDLLVEKDVTEERFQQILGSGILSDVFDDRVDWKAVNRYLVQVGLGLKKPNGPISTLSACAVWKTIRLGTGYKTANVFRNVLEANECRVSHSAYDLMCQQDFAIAIKGININLVIKSVSEIGFENGAQYQQICARALKLGLELCPAEVGPRLRLQYLEQPSGEALIVAMEAIINANGNPCLFHVCHSDGNKILDTISGRPGESWEGSRRFVFIDNRRGLHNVDPKVILGA